MTTPAMRGVTLAFLSMLNTAVPAGVFFGNSETPDVPEGSNQPYGILYPVPGGDTWGSLSLPDAQGTSVYQVSCVGRTSEQGQWLQDLVRATVLARNTNGAHQVAWPAMSNGLVVIMREISEKGGVLVDGVPPRQIFTYHDRYSITVSPT